MADGEVDERGSLHLFYQNSMSTVKHLTYCFHSWQMCTCHVLVLKHCLVSSLVTMVSLFKDSFILSLENMII